MELERIRNSVGEELLRTRHSSGLTVLLNPKTEYTRTFAVVSTHFGSLDALVPDEGGAKSPVPDGVAHFLEHKLFEDEKGDIALRFSSRGASCNAATEFTRTSYHFSCVDQLDTNLETLLELVFKPYFTTESVQKEQGIIEQEIRMYEDEPDWVIFFRMLEAMYHRHPVRVNIAGTVESIHRITPEILYRCHRAYYHPTNMVLAVSGGFESQRLLKTVDSALSRYGFPRSVAVDRPWFEEPESISAPRTEIRFAISRPQICIGFKDAHVPREPSASFRREMISRLLLDVLFSQSSHYHQALYESGVIDDSFDASYSSDHDFGFSTMSGETDEPDRFHQEVLRVLEDVRSRGIDSRDFERMRNRILGRYIRSFNSTESVAETLVRCHFRRLDLEEMLAITLELSVQELEERLRDHLQQSESSSSILWPEKAESGIRS